MNYNEEKVKKFREYTLEDYNRSLIIEDIAQVIDVEKTDGTFTQIGIRPLLDDAFLVEPNFDPRLPGAGRFVAIGERDFLIKNILEKENIKKIEFKEDIKEFPKHVCDLDNAIILLSTKFYVEVFTKLMKRIDYDEKYPRLDRRYRIISVPEKVLGNKMIFIDRDAVLWEKQKFQDPFTKKDEKIDIKIVSKGEKVDITIRSVNKIKDLDFELIKVLEVREK